MHTIVLPNTAVRPGVDRPTARAAFTLIELLVSMAVLLLLVLMVSQLINSTVLSTLSTGKRIDADSQVRQILDRMGSDFAGIAKRMDVNFYFHHHNGLDATHGANDELYFFSDTTGYFATGDGGSTVRNTVSLTGYRVNDQISAQYNSGVPTRFELERLGRGLHWYDPNATDSSTDPLVAMVFLPLTIAKSYSAVLTDQYNNSSNLNPAAASASYVPQWDVLGNQVVRMEFCYLLKDGTLQAIPVTQTAASTNKIDATRPPTTTDDSTNNYTAGSRWYNVGLGATDTQAEIGYVCVNATAGAAVWAPLGLQDVRAVVVALAVLDGRSRLLATPASMASFAALLPDFVAPATATQKSMLDSWQTAMTQPALAATGLPVPSAAAVRLYQRYFYLN